MEIVTLSYYKLLPSDTGIRRQGITPMLTLLLPYCTELVVLRTSLGHDQSPVRRFCLLSAACDCCFEEMGYMQES